MTYRRRAFLVDAVQVQVEKFVETVDGRRWAHKGDWVVTETNGDVHVCASWLFPLKFEVVGDPPDGRDGKSPVGR